MENLPNIGSSVIYSSVASNDWAESFPLGNGRIGAMVHGQPVSEMISLNHDLLWRNYVEHPSYRTHEDMPEIKKLCLQGKWREAEELLSRTIPETGRCIYINPFVPACDLYISMMQNEDEIADFKRILDMEHGVTYVQYKYQGITYTRSYFCSEDKNLFIVKIQSSKPGTISGEVSLSRTIERECFVAGSASLNEVKMEAIFEEGKKFASVTRVFKENGRFTSGKSFYSEIDNDKLEKKFGLGYVFDRDQYVDKNRGASLCFDSCDEITIVTAIAVDNEQESPVDFCYEKLNEYDNKRFNEYFSLHKNKFAEYFNRTKLNLAKEEAFLLPLEDQVRISEESKKLSPAMAQLLYNMSRYVAISSGMPIENTLLSKAPINLQGIWNRDTRPAWESDYHLDLNIQMCYWPMATAGLTEWYGPYLEFIERLMPQGRLTAKEICGAKGAFLTGCCDPFVMGRSDNVGAIWLGSSAWLTQILWIYYEHTLDDSILLRIYKLMQEFAVFYEDMFIEKNGKLTFPFGSSPEMSLIIDGKMQWLSSASSCDLTLVKEMYLNLAFAAERLGETKNYNHYKDIAERILEAPIDANGALKEWCEDHIEGDPGHRHRSPLVTLCPGSLTSLETDPNLTRAMEKLLEKRISYGTSNATSFSYVWDAHILARLRRGDEAWKLLETLIRIHLIGNLMFTTNDHTGVKGGIKWFLGTKVMQVDAQLGLISSLSEMVYQDTQSIIRLLPALPEILSNGSLEGIRGRYGFMGDLYWENGALKEYKLTSTLGGRCKIRYRGEKIKVTCDSLPVPCEINGDGIHCFETEKNKTYIIKAE